MTMIYHDYGYHHIIMMICDDYDHDDYDQNDTDDCAAAEDHADHD